MKKMIFALLTAAVLCGCGGGERYTITVIPEEGLEDVRLMRSDMEFVEMAAFEYDEQTGRFTAKGTVEEPVEAVLVDSYNEPIAMLFVEKGDITVEFDEGEYEYVVSGTPSNDGFRNARVQMLEKSLELDRMRESGEFDEESLNEELYAFFDKLIDENNDNIFGVSMFASIGVQNKTPDEILARIEKFPKKLRNSEVLKPVVEYAEAVKKTADGSDYIEIEAAGIDGETIALSSVVGEGKWVLVDFWATWCGPCRGELPYLKDAYAKYADKGFVIYGVSLDNDAEGWASFVEENEMTWINVIDVRDDKSTPAAEAYGIISIPTNFLISPEGKIAARNLRGDDVEKKLAEIFE